MAALALTKWLPAALAFSSYWTQRAQQVGLQPDGATTRRDLSTLPAVLEAELRGAGGPGGPALLLRPTQEQVKARASSSALMAMAAAIRRQGTEGEHRAVLEEYKPVHVHRGGADGDLAVASSRTDLDRMHRCGARAARVLGLTSADYLVNAVPSGPRLPWWGVYHLALGTSMLALHPRGAGDELGAVLDAFALIPTTVIAVEVGEAISLAALTAEYGGAVAGLRTIITVGPPPDDDLRNAIRDAWRSAGANESSLVVRAVFAPPEGRALWAEPRQAPTGLVTYPDLEILEVVDPLTGASTDGAGDLVYTSLGWHGTALLRFQTGVFVSGIDPAPCPASTITTPRIVGPVVERGWQPLVRGPDGRIRHFDLRTAGAVLSSTPGIQSWRIELRGPTRRVPHDRVLVEVAGALQPGDVQGLGHRMETAAGAAPHDVRVVADPRPVEAAIAQAGSPFVDTRGTELAGRP